MKDGIASHTARSVAARRLEYERVAAPYGDPAADETLTSDVADGLTPARGRMHEYIRARTAFFDRIVVHSIAQGITQVVIGGAGYDGRAFRYAKLGVRWFEVDHPATQADKRERIARLGLATPQLSFIPADFTADPVAEPLLAAGLDPALPALFLFEGVAVYLDRPVTERVLAEFRAVTPPGSTLAISVSTGSATSRTRARFQQRVAELGEPARTVLTFDQTADLLSAAGWELGEVSDRQRSAGLLLARATPDAGEPLAAPATTDRQPGIAAAHASAPVAKTPQRGALPAVGRAPGDLGARDAARPAPEPPASLPLSALLSQALVAFTIEADNETEHRLPHRTQNHGLASDAPPGAPWLTSLLMYANCLRHLPDEGITIAELAGRARTATNLDGMRRWGYVTFTLDPGDPSIAPESPPGGRARVHRSARPKPDTVIRPTAWGIAARDTWRSVTAEVESRWRGRLGDADFVALRAALAGIVEQLDPNLPDCLPILHHGLFTRRDQSTAAGARPAVNAAPEASAAPVSGTGAMPPDAAPVADLPLWALLARPLLAFARQYEAEPGPSLAISADVLRVLPDAGVHTKDIPALGGVSKESLAMALGVLRPRGLVTEGPDPAGTRFKVTRLTASGIAARDEYPALTADIERDWRARFGGTTVAALRQALEPLVAGDPPRLYAGLEPYPDGWRARLPWPATLPHYPMTLHRGGYPDGS
ncbi:MAG TPA: class I SAM-dependent methyltransferase [Trebonia sp.]